MCGVIGIISDSPVAQDLYDGLMTMQHRGQDAAGIMTYDGKFHIRKNLGLIRDVFHTRHMSKLTGNIGLGHTRYSTMGSGDPNECQPFLGQSPFGVILSFNGNIFNSPELKKELFEKDHRLINSDSDAEVLLNLFTKSLSRQNIDKLESKHIWDAVESVHKRAKGAYSVVVYIAGYGMVAFRDPHGIRPLQYGKKMVGLRPDYIFASESIALHLLGYKLEGDVGAGEAIFVDEKTRKISSKVITKSNHTPCIFEHIYFARPDSVLDEISVYKARIRMGKYLAKRIKKENIDIDVVMPVPDSARTAAMAMSEELGLPYREGLIKNRYIGRTFIMPGQEIRKKSIRYKLNPMKMEIDGKKILLVDDSIVRGNTSKKIIQVMKDAGAKKIYFASYAPPVKFPCLFGIDIPTPQELIASDSSIEEIRKWIGADKLFYGEIDDVKKACITGNPKLKDMCMACFDGEYKCKNVTKEILLSNAVSRRTQRSCAYVEGEEEEEQLNLV
ncbi:amidophosphoribosyltransferase [Candidatus Peregrinibacteria bacterium]|nr:amidophosphoribosyltransferase [Candidatus Peregrinibacteria bacterium]